VAVLGAADDALDLMGARVDAEDLDLLDCADNGISAGEQTELRVKRSVVARCPTGLLAKNDSRIDVDDVAVAAAKTGIRVERRSDYYTGESSAHGRGLWFVAVATPRDLVARPTFDVAPQGNTAVVAARQLATAADLVGWAGRRRSVP
jgi:hypothetical protein